MPDALFAPQQFGDTDLIRQIQLEGDTLYFRTLDSLQQVPTSGGTPQVLADLSQEPPSEFWVTDSALLVRATTDLFTVPKAGGAPTPLGPALAPAPSNFAATQLDGADLYWVAETAGSHGIFHRTLSGSTVNTVYTTKDDLVDLQLVAGTLYFMDKTAADIEGVPVAGGTPSKLTDANASDRLVAHDGANLYVTGSLGDATSTNYGLYRQPVSGKAPAHLATGLFITIESALDSSGAYFGAPANVSPNQVDPGDVKPSLLFAAASATATELRWCIDSSYTLHAVAVAGNAAYISVYNTPENKATIARVKF